MTASDPAIHISGLRKAYGGLRPLRILSLTVGRGDRVAMSGLDAAAAEVLVNLVTGATLPDEGEVRVCGTATSAIHHEAEWLASLDRLGVVSTRAVLLSSATVLQNLAMPFTLSIDPVPADVAERAARLATEAGLGQAELVRAAGTLPRESQARVHLARAIARDPGVLILEHPTLDLAREHVSGFARDIVRLADQRQLAVVAITEDADFARALKARRLRLDPSTGALAQMRAWWLGQNWWA